MQPLFDLLSKYNLLTSVSKELLPTLLVGWSIKKNQIILKEGQVCRHIYFIKAGLIRIYYILDGKEVTLWLLKEGDIFIEVESFFGQVPSRRYIMTLEDTELVGITYDELQGLCREDPAFLWNRVYITEEYYRKSEQMHMDMLMKSAFEKYKTLMETAPKLLERVPLKYLYSYLGLSKASFDRARSKYASGAVRWESVK